MVEVEVEFKYDAEQPDELSINVGDIIKNVIMSEGGWWEGELNGKKGMFPDNFVKVIKKEEKSEPKEPKTVQASKRQSVKDLANKLKDQVHEGPAPARKKTKKRAKVIYSYEPENDDEIKLEVGEMVDVLKQEEEGWWEGVVNGKQGMFPSNFVEVFEEDGSDEKEETKESETNIIKGKKVMGVGLGNIFEGGQIKLRSTVGGPGSNKKPSPAEKEKRPEKPPEEPMARKARAAREISVEEDTLLPKTFEDQCSCYPAALIDNRDTYPDILQNGVGQCGESLEETGMPKSGLGSEILSQTDSESETISSELVEVGDIEIGNEDSEKNNVDDVETNTEALDDSYSDLKYLDSANVVIGKLVSDNRALVGLPSENIMVEDELIEYENVDIHPDFDEGISASASNSDIDQNNQNTRNIHFADHIQKSSGNKIQKELSDMSNDLKCILDDLDSHLNENVDSSLRVSPGCLEYHEKSHVSPCQLPDDGSHNPVCQSDCVRNRESISQIDLSLTHPVTTPVHLSKISHRLVIGQVKSDPSMCLIGEHKTPPYEGEFSNALDSIYVTRKRSLHSTEKQSDISTDSTPLRPVSYETGTMEKERMTSRKSVSFSPVHTTSVWAKPVGNPPKYGVSSLSNKSHQTYFASLEKSGHLSPFIKSIAKKYGLFNRPVSSQSQAQDSLDSNDLELDVSYASTLLGKSGDLSESDSELENTSFSSDERNTEEEDISLISENQQECEIKVSDTAQSMINNYLYDVLESAESKQKTAEQSEIMDIYLEQFVDSVISKSYAALKTVLDENNTTGGVFFHSSEVKSSDSDAEDHDSELSDLEFYSDSVLLCITQGPDDESPPLSTCSPSLYPQRIEPEAPCSSVKRSESAVVTGNEKECHWFSRNKSRSQDDELFKPLENRSHGSKWNNCLDHGADNNILSYMMDTSAAEPKLPSSGHVCQTSSYCRIPFGSGDAPSFWFKKDFKESPKEKKAKRKIEMKIKSPGKRSFTAFYQSSEKEEILYQVQSLAKLASKAHQQFFRMRLDAVGKKFSSDINDYTTRQSSVERSPAKKRRRKQEKNYRYKTDWNNSSLSPVEEGSVEVYFTNLVDHTESSNNVTAPVGTSAAVTRHSDSENTRGSAKVDWSRTLFGSRSEGTVCRAPENPKFQFGEKGFKPYVRESVSTQHQSENSPFISPFKKDRHFRQRPVQCVGSSPLINSFSERRQRRNIWPKVKSPKESEPVILTGFRSLSSNDEQGSCQNYENDVDMEMIHGQETSKKHSNTFVHSCTQRLVFPGNFHISVSEIDDEPLPLSDTGTEYHLIEDSYVQDRVSYRDVSTMTDFSENDVFTIDWAESFTSLGDSFGSGNNPVSKATKKSHGELDISSSIGDEGNAFSMFYMHDSEGSDDGYSEDNQKGVCNLVRDSEEIDFAKAKTLNYVSDEFREADQSDFGGNSSNLEGPKFITVGNQVEYENRKRSLMTTGRILNSEATSDVRWVNVASENANIVERKIDKLEHAVRSHLCTSSNAVADVLDIINTRKNMYEAISDVVESCTDVMEYSKESAEKSSKNVGSSDGLEEDSKTDWDISPDPDALLKDFEEIDLSDTPQYVTNDANNEEMKQFLDDVLQPFDDIFVDSFTSLNLSESPVPHSGTKDTKLEKSHYDDGSRETTVAGDQTNEEENVLNKSFLDDEESANSSVATPIKFGHENASSTPIDEPCSPVCFPDHVEKKIDMKVSDDDESFMSARSHRINQHDYSKNTGDSFESYRTGIDRSSMLGWSEEDTLNASSGNEGFLKTISESSAERTCFGPNERLVVAEDLDSHCMNDGSSVKITVGTGDGDAWDHIIDPEGIQVELETDSREIDSDPAADENCSAIKNLRDNTNKATGGLPRTTQVNNLLKTELTDNLSKPDGHFSLSASLDEQTGSPTKKATCFYVGSSEESVHTHSGSEV